MIGLKQLTRLDVSNQKIANIEKLYRSDLKNDIHVQQNIKKAKPKYMLFSVRNINRDKIIKYLIRRGIDTKREYMINCSSHFGEKVRCENAERLSRTVFHLPFYPQLTEEDILYISKTLKSALKKIP